MFQVIDNTTGLIRYAGRSRARVIDNLDPEQKGRIRVAHAILGESVWIPYLNVAGMFSVPEVDDLVYVECDCGYESHPIAWGGVPLGIETTLQDDPNPVFRRINPSNRGMYTPDGELFEMDDGSTLSGLDKGVRITGSNGAKIHLNSKTDKITHEVAFGDKLEISRADGIQASTPAAGGTSLSMKGGVIDLQAAIAIGVTSNICSVAADSEASIGTTLNDAKVNIAGGKIAIGNNAGELLDLLDQQLDALINNATTFVSTAVGPGVLSPAVVSTLTVIKTTLALLKGTL